MIEGQGKTALHRESRERAKSLIGEPGRRRGAGTADGPAAIGRSRRHSFRAFWLITLAVAMAAVTPAVMADNFGAVHYDAKRDQLIVTMTYEGTNPHHHFSVRWGRCHKLDRRGAPRYRISVGILDDQGNDAAKRRYTKTIRVSLAALSCRPARVTLWTTPLIHRVTLDVP